MNADHACFRGGVPPRDAGPGGARSQRTPLRYDTLVPFLGQAAPNFLRIASSTTMLGEY
jgi:hypothetical protein